MEVVRRGSPRRPTEVKNPENACHVNTAVTFWILHCVQNDEHHRSMRSFQ